MNGSQEVSGEVEKELRRDERVRTMRAVASQLLATAAELAGDDPQRHPPAPALSERERQLLEALAAGVSNVELSNELFVSVHTVKNNAKTLFRKLGARNQSHAVALAYECGLLQAACPLEERHG